ncbi:hypothetical protein AB0I84_41145, partial [Streptomyces spectabilis]
RQQRQRLNTANKGKGSEFNRPKWVTVQPPPTVHELAGTLGSRAEQEPVRFAAFALTLGPDAPGAYLRAIVEAVAPHLDTEHWGRLALHVHQSLGQEAAFTLCRTLQSFPVHYTPALLPILTSCAAAAQPEGELRELDDEGTHTDLLAVGLSTTRGQAALTCAALLFHDARHLPALRPLVLQLATDPVLAVRVCAAEAVRALLKHDPQAALGAASQLMTHQELSVHDAPTTQQLLIHALARDPARFAPHLAQALEGPQRAVELAGQTWAVTALQGNLTPDLPASAEQLNTIARRGAAAVLARNPEHYRLLLPLFNDADESVRESASAVMRHAFALAAFQAEELVQAFVTSQAFPDNVGQLAFALHDATGPLPPAALDACEHIIGQAGSSLSDIRTIHAAHGHYVITAVLRLYRQSQPALRIRCLDIIDSLSRADAQGLNAALEGER